MTGETCPNYMKLGNTHARLHRQWGGATHLSANPTIAGDASAACAIWGTDYFRVGRSCGFIAVEDLFALENDFHRLDCAEDQIPPLQSNCWVL